MIAKLAIFAPALAAMLSLSACASGSRQASVSQPHQGPTPLDQYTPQITRAPEQVALAVHPQGLSPRQQSVLAAFVSRWRDDGAGNLVVRAPTNGVAPGQARRMADATIAFLAHLGVPAQRLRLQGYDAQGATAAPVLASFERYEAEIPDCGAQWDDLTATRKNNVPRNFGCATTANLSAQIANPRDLVDPAASDPSDNSRREVILGKYRDGQITSSTRDEQASGQVSGH